MPKNWRFTLFVGFYILLTMNTHHLLPDASLLQPWCQRGKPVVGRTCCYAMGSSQMRAGTAQQPVHKLQKAVSHAARSMGQYGVLVAENVFRCRIFEKCLFVEIMCVFAVVGPWAVWKRLLTNPFLERIASLWSS